MDNAIKRYFPAQVNYFHPKGGIFLWVTLPQTLSSMTLFNKAIKQNVAFVPSDPFYVSSNCTNNLRLNFSSIDPVVIGEDIKRLGYVLNAMLVNDSI
ncbi:hypothetical protein ACLKMH_14970 [Psychromonas sp. KJ10-10]|uniref:hypothetical protein n=1 Tax=Psychromonas sp. KJ10-10 TaxID=3391823 RepID=UPI0039B46FA0